MRILFWNVEHFSQDKFFLRKRKRRNDDDEDYGAPAAPPYFNLLYNAITANNPDIVIIIEVRPGGMGAPGTLPADVGAVTLLKRLRSLDVQQWALVPPLISGTGQTAECIAVYYRRSATLFFTGPGIWPGGAGPVGAPGAATVPADYPDPYGNSFSRTPSTRIVPAGNNLYNPGLMERRLGGQVAWYAAPAMGMGPAAPVSFGAAQYRTPFRVTFFDSAAGHNYNIIAFHAPPLPPFYAGPPAASPPVVGVQTASNLAEVQQAAANETTVFCGDFNVDLFNGAATAAAYGAVAGGGWAQVVNTTGGAAMPAAFPDRGYLMTHMTPLAAATPANTNGYPAFGYLDNSLDNAFVHGGALANATVANLVTGAPYNGVMPIPANMPAGALAYGAALTDLTSLGSPAGINPLAGNYFAKTNDFRSIDNYARIRGVSDHLAIVFDC